MSNRESDGERYAERGPQNSPLAHWCALCGEGYNPNLEITIADEPQEILGEEKYAWSHLQCKRDHDRVFLEVFGDEEGSRHGE